MGSAEGTAVVALVVDTVGEGCGAQGPAQATITFQGPPPGNWLRCDANGDRTNDISDAVYSLAFLFTGGNDLACPESADCNGDGSLDISDPVYDLRYLFLGGPSPAASFPLCDLFAGCEARCPWPGFPTPQGL